MDNALIVCGRGALAFRLAAELRFAGESVVMVCEGATGAERDALAAAGAVLVDGSPLDESVLRQAGVGQARSVAAVADDDVGNLRVAFAAQKVNPTVRVVVRLFNEDMGQHIETLFHDCVILSASSIAAPYFVSAALGHAETHRVVASGRSLQVTRYDEHLASAGAAAGIIAVLSHPESNGTATLFPDRPEIGDVVLRDIGPLSDIDPLIAIRKETTRAARIRERMTDAASTFRAFFDRRFRILFGVIAFMVGLTVLVFAHFKHLSLVAAVYFTVVTLTTVGYGDYNLQADPAWLKIYGVGFILVGATVIAIFYSFLIDTLVGVRLARALGTIHTKFRDHIIVCGLGNTGYRVAERLKDSGLDVVVIDRDEDNRHLPAVRRLGIPIVFGDASLADTLSAAQVESASCLVTCTDDDIVGLEAAANARTVHPELRVVLRLFDDEISKRVEHSLSIRFSRSMASLAAPVFANQMMRHAVIQSVTVGRTSRHTLIFGEAEVDAGSVLDGSTISSIEEDGTVKVVAIARPDEESQWLPFEPGRTVNADDRLVVIAEREEWRRITE